MGFCVQTQLEKKSKFLSQVDRVLSGLEWSGVDIKNIKYPDLGQVELWTSLKTNTRQLYLGYFLKS